MKKLLSITLLLSACASLPPVPHHVQYGVHADVSPPGFYGVDNENKSHVYKSFYDPSMKAGQCLSADDYKAWQKWIQAVEQIAEKNCQGAQNVAE